MVREIRCIVCGGEKPLSRLKYCNRCALRIKLKQSRGKKREYRLTIKDYDKGDRLDYKKAWRESRGWNEYMREYMRKYRRKNSDRIREQNRAASRRYRKRASVKTENSFHSLTPLIYNCKNYGKQNTVI